MPPKANKHDDDESAKEARHEEALSGASSPTPSQVVPDREVGTVAAGQAVIAGGGSPSQATPAPASTTPPGVPLTLAQIDAEIAASVANTKRLRLLRTDTAAFERRRAEIGQLTGAK